MFQKKRILEHYKKSKTKCKILIWDFIEEIMLSRVQNSELASFKL